jgi:hypothetical protein
VTSYTFTIDVDEDALASFAEVSGDFNPLHVDAAFAAGTPYRHRVLHGAFCAGLVSRMAGMHLPGKGCLLHGIQLRFIAPIIPPVTLRVDGEEVRHAESGGEVSVTVSDAASGKRYTEGRYEYGYHATAAGTEMTRPTDKPQANRQSDRSGREGDIVLVAGSSGALGAAVCEKLGDRALPLSRADAVHTEDGRARVIDRIAGQSVCAAIHCGWPAPDNRKLVNLPDPRLALNTGISDPLSQVIGLASVLMQTSASAATLVLTGSTAAHRGRHMWRAPVYSLGKSLIPTLVQILATEMGASQNRCVGVTFDILDGGMNAQLSAAQRVANMDRSPLGALMTMRQAAELIEWLIGAPYAFVSGATVDLSGSAIP